MGWIRPALIAAGVVAIGGLVGFQVFKPQIASAAFDRAIGARFGRALVDELPDGLHVAVCGAGSPLPDPKRAGPCLAVIAGERMVLVDAGSGGQRNLALMQLPAGRLDAIYLTHFHSDHIDGLGEVLLQRWAGSGRAEPTLVVGPTGVEHVVDGFRTAYALDVGYRVAHHGAETMPAAGAGGRARSIGAPTDAMVIDDGGDLTVTAFPVTHNPVEPSVGYRFDYKGRSVVISGDTTYDPRLVAAAQGVDVLFHEALDPEMVMKMRDLAQSQGNVRFTKIANDILDYHASPEDAARAAEEAGAEALVLYHIVPPLPATLLEAAFLGSAKDEFSGDITVATDGLLVSLPAGSTRIRMRKLF